MSEIIKNNVGKLATIFLKNNFKYAGLIINCDELFVTLHDDVTNKPQIIALTDIQRVQIEKESEQ